MQKGRLVKSGDSEGFYSNEKAASRRPSHDSYTAIPLRSSIRITFMKHPSRKTVKLNS